jgi:hypothetical protein|tara:strand:+ start:615 stop:797 length:183 start_codon:yes stop_codon:yes gene_type:complete
MSDDKDTSTSKVATVLIFNTDDEQRVQRFISALHVQGVVERATAVSFNEDEDGYPVLYFP